MYCSFSEVGGKNGNGMLVGMALSPLMIDCVIICPSVFRGLTLYTEC